MTPFHQHASRSACALAVSLFLVACGGGSGSSSSDSSTDTTAPAVVVTSVAGTSDVTFTFTFSEDVGSSFTVDDVTVTGGTKAPALVKVNATQYTLVVTPTSGATTVTADIASGKFSDLSGNTNAAGISKSLGMATNNNSNNTPTTTTCGTSGPCTMDFSDSTTGVVGFEGLVSAAIVAEPTNASNKVLKLVKGKSGQPWAGATVYFGDAAAQAQLVGNVDLSTNKVLTMKVYSPAANHKVTLKLEIVGGDSAGVAAEVAATTTAANSWETLSFDFTGKFSSTQIPNRISIFPEWGPSITDAPATDMTYYFDDLKFTKKSSTPAPASSLAFASDYTQVTQANQTTVKSKEGGTTGFYIDSNAVNVQSWWSGVASVMDTVSPAIPTNDPNFYFGYGIDSSATKPTYMGAYVNAPNNGTASVSSYSSLSLYAWGNDQLMNSHPTLTFVLNPPVIAGCQPQLVSTASVTAAGVQKYTLQLSGFTLQTACGLASASAALATGVQSVHVQILGSNFQYTTDAAKCTDADTASNCYPNGLNLGKITFN